MCCFCAQLDLSGNKIIGAEGARPLADALCVNGSLTALDVSYNNLEDEDEAVLKGAVNGREGFVLTLEEDEY